MTPRHTPVLFCEVIALLKIPIGGQVVDATIGLGGHAAGLLQCIGPDGLLIGLDADGENLQHVHQRFIKNKNVKLFNKHFETLESVLESLGGIELDAVLADLGVSSTQLDDPARGFSFDKDGPLDMRFDQRDSTTAADLVNRLSERELADLIYRNGQERASRRIAKMIHQARRKKRITTTSQLADIVRKIVRPPKDPRRRAIHPATRTFMALRIAVNKELERLEQFVAALPRILKPGGRAAVISFHSLEDGICKRAFREMKQNGLASIVTKKPVIASSEERTINPRSRSAKLRVIEKLRTD